MAYVTASNGEQFFVWPLPAASARSVSPGISVNDIENDLGNGYFASTLYGSDTGLRTWSVTQNTMGGATFPLPFVTGIHGGSVSQQQALWDLYLEQKVSGRPFAFPCPRDGQKYLAKFVGGDRLVYEKIFRADQYSTGIELTQVREDGVTIFDLETYAFNQDATCYLFNENGHFTPNWVNEVDGANTFTSTGTGTPTFGGNAQNGINTVRFDGTTDFFSGTFPSDISEIIIALTIRETTFGGNDGLFAGVTQLLGTSGGTKWQNPSISGFEYSLNGFEYEATDMQAPMNNVFGICHFRSPNAVLIDTGVGAMNLGKFSTDFIAADIGEIFIATEVIPLPDARQIIEHLAIKWAANT